MSEDFHERVVAHMKRRAAEIPDDDPFIANFTVERAELMWRLMPDLCRVLSKTDSGDAA